MNDIPNATNQFNFILYADDTSLYTTIQIQETASINVNEQLGHEYDWLAVNKLSLNIKKTKYMIFHAMNKNIEGLITEPVIDNVPIERVSDFDFLGLNLNDHMETTYWYNS